MKTIHILGLPYTLDLSRTLRDLDCLGRADHCKMIIQIANDVTVEQQESTLIHEIIESINSILELKLDHHTISCLEAGLYQSLTTNGVNLEALMR